MLVLLVSEAQDRGDKKECGTTGIMSAVELGLLKLESGGLEYDGYPYFIVAMGDEDFGPNAEYMVPFLGLGGAQYPPPTLPNHSKTSPHTENRGGGPLPHPKDHPIVGGGRKVHPAMACQGETTGSTLAHVLRTAFCHFATSGQIIEPYKWPTLRQVLPRRPVINCTLSGLPLHSYSNNTKIQKNIFYFNATVVQTPSNKGIYLSDRLFSCG